MNKIKRARQNRLQNEEDIRRYEQAKQQKQIETRKQTVLTLLILSPAIFFLFWAITMLVSPVKAFTILHFGWVIAIYIVAFILHIAVAVYCFWDVRPIKGFLLTLFSIGFLALMIMGLSTLNGKTMIIDNQKQINVIRNIPNPEKANYELNTDIDCTVTGSKWFGYIQNYYGVFNGNKHTIKNISINISNSADFGMVINNHGTIKNLCISNAQIHQRGEQYAYDVDLATLGTMCGINSGTIENCRVNDTFLWRDTGYRGGFTYIGGIVGLNDNGIVKNCEFIN